MDDQGKTDAVASVSISVGEFIGLVEDCLRQAAGEEKPAAPAEGTQVDAIAGATISSRAVANGVNSAFTFLRETALREG